MNLSLSLASKILIVSLCRTFLSGCSSFLSPTQESFLLYPDSVLDERVLVAIEQATFLEGKNTGSVLAEPELVTDALVLPGDILLLRINPNIHAISLLARYNEAFSHFAFDGVAKFALSSGWYKTHPPPRLLLPASISADILRSVFGVSPNQVIVADQLCRQQMQRLRGGIDGWDPLKKCVLHFSSLIYPEFVLDERVATQGARIVMGLMMPRLLDRLANRNLVRGKSTPEREDNLVLYLSRSHGQTRCVSDEGTLVSGLDGAVRGVQGRLVVLHGINSTSVQHRLLFASARVLLGPHGGAFGNMIYCSAGTHVLEFMPLLLDRPRPCFFGLAHGLGLTHSLLEPAEGTFSFEDPNRKMVISHQHLITAVTHLLALPRPSPSG
eukprot:m.276909 g.276909  ORF g.276909 m.276909 type:complete len:383 (+) comp54863_c0_seq6:542-1690(+)